MASGQRPRPMGLSHVTQRSAPAPGQAQHRGGRTAELTLQTAVLVSVSGAEVLLTERGTQQTADTMGTPSGPSRRRCIPWNRLLLAGERG